VIGGGAGGLVTAFGAVGTGARVGMIERSLMGGDCLNTGCVPSKAFIKAASVAHSVKTAAKYGILVGEVKIDFGAVMERMRKIRADIAEADSCKRVSTAGIDMFLGQAIFTGPHEVIVNDQLLTFSKCCIATGARPFVPDYPGILSIPYYTSENIFNLTE
jgi:pyruvate/2-oxoglutarate dehydrogenase complex dihydrolipoamide dehydrogenase (E3) component